MWETSRQHQNPPPSKGPGARLGEFEAPAKLKAESASALKPCISILVAFFFQARTGSWLAPSLHSAALMRQCRYGRLRQHSSAPTKVCRVSYNIRCVMRHAQSPTHKSSQKDIFERGCSWKKKRFSDGHRPTVSG